MLGSLSGSTLTYTSDEREVKPCCSLEELNSQSKSPAPQSLKHRVEVSEDGNQNQRAVDSRIACNQQREECSQPIARGAAGGENPRFQRTDRLPVIPC
jgi:hypothetical protein